MLINHTKWRRLYFIFIFITLISCGHKRQVYEKVAFHHSLKQELVVENRLNRAVVLVAKAEEGNHPLPSQAHFTISFRVYTVANIERAANKSWYEARPGTQANVLIESEDPSFFTAVGDDVKLQVKMPDGQIWEYFFNFGECWFDQPAEEMQHIFRIEEEPMAGIPVEICP